MKKLLSVAVSVSMALSTAAVGTVHAVSYGDGPHIMLLGDSIASGYGLSTDEFNYGQMIAEYLGGSVENYAVSGYNSADTLAQLRDFSSEQKEQLAQTDIVILSTGANDMMEFASASLLDFAEKEDLLYDGITSADFPKRPSLSSIRKFVDMDALSSYTSNVFNAITFSDKLNSISQNITYTDANPNGATRVQVIAKQIIPNINSMVDEIREVNPNARIILQTVYNPLQFEKTYEEQFKSSISASYSTAYVQFKTIFDQVTKKYAEQVQALDNVEVSDVLTDISSLYIDETNYKNRYGWYFTNIQAEKKEDVDIHPNQAGHVAIAATLLNTIGEIKKEGGGLLEYVFDRLPDKENYPAYAYAQYEKVARMSGQLVLPITTTVSTTETTVPTTSATDMPVPTTSAMVTNISTALTIETTVPVTSETDTNIPTTLTTETAVPTTSETETSIQTIVTTEMSVPTTSAIATNIPTDLTTETSVPTTSSIETNIPTTLTTETADPTTSSIETNIPTILTTETADPITSSIETNIPTTLTTETAVPITSETETNIPTTLTTKTVSSDTAPVTTETSVPGSVSLGDVNNDGAVNSIDASAILIEYAVIQTSGGNGRFTKEQNEAGDVNKDGIINSKDATLIFKYYMYFLTGGKLTDMAEWLETVK